MDPIVAHLGAHEFQTLFVERLGWDRAHAKAASTADGINFSFETIAHKRGFKIVQCRADRYTMFNRRRLRALQRQLLRVAHEHIVIYSCDDPRKQVWQWAVRMPDGRRVRHREHPFFSSLPPESLVARLRGLRFLLDEEERVTLVDALDRVRGALDTHAELDLFVTRPGYAEQSDRLARAMRDGGTAAFHAFVLFHRRLAKWGSRRMQRRFGMDEEEAEQIGMIGVLRAAAKFKPELGYQFSTYATRAILQQCERDGPAERLTIGMPAIVYWLHVRLNRRLEGLDTRSRTGAASRCLRWMAQRDPRFGRRWETVARTLDVRSLSDQREPEYHAARQVVAPDERRSTWTEYAIECLHAALDSLAPDEAQILRLRYGFDGAALTLEAIGNLLGLTRERIRQRQARSEQTLRALLASKLGESLRAPAAYEEEDEEVTPVADGGRSADVSGHTAAKNGSATATFELRAPVHESQGALFAHAS